MFVRWQQYRSQAQDKRRRERNDARARLKAVLVESTRINGEPRQKHIAFLGSVSVDGSDRRRFWFDVTTRLNQLNNLVSVEERKCIGAAIAEKVGGQLMTVAELKQFDQDRSDLGESLRAVMHGPARAGHGNG
jgi:hypothetical protein